MAHLTLIGSDEGFLSCMGDYPQECAPFQHFRMSVSDYHFTPPRESMRHCHAFTVSKSSPPPSPPHIPPAAPGSRSVSSNISPCASVVMFANSRISFRYSPATGRGLRSRSYSPHAFTRPCFSASCVSQSRLSVKLYHVNPSTGIPSRRIRSTFVHCFHSHRGLAPASGVLVSVCMTGR